MMDKNNIKAVIFDYDGTLVDTESICYKLYPVIFNKYGYKLTHKQLLELRSAGYPKRNELFTEWFGIQKPDKIVEKIERKLIKEFDKYIKVNPIKLKQGCEEILRYLVKKDIPVFIATSTLKERVIKQIKDLGIYKYITEIYSVQHVKYGKPYPDIYELVCYKIGVEPGQCIAVEDSPNGIISACEAGCKTIMIPDLAKPDKQLKKEYDFKVINSLLDLKKII